MFSNAGLEVQGTKYIKLQIIIHSRNFFNINNKLCQANKISTYMQSPACEPHGIEIYCLRLELMMVTKSSIDS